MNLRALQYLVTLAELRHFGRAAEACFISQPTLSTQIKKLEQELGVQLVERAPRKVMLTAAGAEIVDRARIVLRDIKQIEAVAARSSDPEAGVVRLGIFPTLAPYLLPHVVAGIHREFPRLELLLIEDKTEQLLQRLRAGSLDAALLAIPVDDEGLCLEPLFTEPFVAAVPVAHPLAGHSKLKIEDLNGQTVLLLEDGHCLREQALEVCQMASANEKSGFRATSLETLRQMVAAGVGMTLLPLLATLPPVAVTESIRLLTFSEPQPQREIGMVWRKSSAIGTFLRVFAGQFRDIPARLTGGL